jgi:hypothetical protein
MGKTLEAVDNPLDPAVPAGCSDRFGGVDPGVEKIEIACGSTG